MWQISSLKETENPYKLFCEKLQSKQGIRNRNPSRGIIMHQLSSVQAIDSFPLFIVFVSQINLSVYYEDPFDK